MGGCLCAFGFLHGSVCGLESRRGLGERWGRVSHWTPSNKALSNPCADTAAPENKYTRYRLKAPLCFCPRKKNNTLLADAVSWGLFFFWHIRAKKMDFSAAFFLRAIRASALFLSADLTTSKTFLMTPKERKTLFPWWKGSGATLLRTETTQRQQQKLFLCVQVWLHRQHEACRHFNTICTNCVNCHVLTS